MYHVHVGNSPHRNLAVFCAILWEFLWPPHPYCPQQVPGTSWPCMGSHHHTFTLSSSHHHWGHIITPSHYHLHHHWVTSSHFHTITITGVTSSYMYIHTITGHIITPSHYHHHWVTSSLSLFTTITPTGFYSGGGNEVHSPPICEELPPWEKWNGLKCIFRASKFKKFSGEHGSRPL